jgi:hypothetical protein
MPGKHTPKRAKPNSSAGARVAHGLAAGRGRAAGSARRRRAVTPDRKLGREPRAAAGGAREHRERRARGEIWDAKALR